MPAKSIPLSARLTQGRLRRLLWPGLMTVAMLAVLIGLGAWQLERLAWKNAILAHIAAAERAPAVALPAHPSPFQKVRISGHLRTDLTAWFGDQVHDTPSGPRMGAQLIQPLERDGAPAILVDRGWVPLPGPLPDAAADGPSTIEGFIRPSERPGTFTPAPDLTAKRFYAFDAEAIGAALGLKHVAPYVLVALGPEQGQIPDPAHRLPRPPNNHFVYAMTWFAIAAGLIAVFLSWAREALGRAPPA